MLKLSEPGHPPRPSLDMANFTQSASRIPQKPSLLPQIARHASPEKALVEMTSSDSNARTMGTMLPPHGARKHALSTRTDPKSQPGAPDTYSIASEPEPKRRTLKDRAGETKKLILAAPPSSRPVSGSVKTSSALGSYRDHSLSASVSSRSASSASRTTSNSSLAASVGPGTRPQSMQSYGRPKPPHGHSRVPSKIGQSRPATSLAHHQESMEGPTPNGMSVPMTPILFSPLHPSKTRSHTSLRQVARRVPDNGYGPTYLQTPSRSLSLSTSMQGLTLQSDSRVEPAGARSPTKLPKAKTPVPQVVPVSQIISPVPKSPRKSPRKFENKFLTKDSNIKAWNHDEQSEKFERVWNDWYTKINQTCNETTDMKETINIYKSTSTFRSLFSQVIRTLIPCGIHDESLSELTRLCVVLVSGLEKTREELTETTVELRTELAKAGYKIDDARRQIDNAQREHDIELDDLERQQRNVSESIRQESKQNLDTLKADHREEMRELKQRLERELDQERSQRIQAVGQLSTQGALNEQRQQLEIEAKEREIRAALAENERVAAEVDRERSLNVDLRQNLTSAASDATAMESSRHALQAKIEYLESDSKSQSEAYATMQRQMREAIDEAQRLQDKLRKEETCRRKLHNQVQELKGNIRVFCRVRPCLNGDSVDDQAKMAFPDDGEDSKEIEVRGAEEKSSLGTVTTKKYPFVFDRVFGPDSQNQQVFDEISQLIQSALDGYNVCIFCYGQTGSGKTYTMSSQDGMIPRAVHMIYDTARSLEERGWSYHMEGSFVEVYNENLNDLLGRADDFDKKKHEIRHDMQTCKTTITDITTVDLDSPDKVEQILTRAMNNRSVAATKANERSSRSHSVFILKICGRNNITGETSEGTLNLVDLAGSERLSQSKVEGARLKETQNINRSLSCLGDVIGALGQGKDGGHIPYRNSKLTYLLQFSLGGNSKTLMFCMVSPLQAHLAETLTSLRFATKV